MNVPVRADAIGAWKLRFSSDAAGYGGAGSLPNDIPSLESAAAQEDAPRRLIADPAEQAIRTVRLPAWSAAVYIRDLDVPERET